ncbi:hypothetical protein HPB47_005135 [Ixodes persulcatus]|uniref:Uncharacterized protein n=1 Tax=Ixodes persulcatus TaxID=34615 RepID=A0AC60PEI9_IXOPE|nr:hypothetical protein HPB47_005135 [Ixodes persulcatus]
MIIFRSVSNCLVRPISIFQATSSAATAGSPGSRIWPTPPGTTTSGESCGTSSATSRWPTVQRVPSSKVARLSAKELNCPEDHEKPKFENSRPDAKVDSLTMTTVASPDEGDILEHRDDRNQIEKEDSEEALASEALTDATATTQTMKNEIDLVLSQRKVMQKQAAHSRKANRNSSASLVGWSITLQLFFAVVASGMTTAGFLVRHS